MTTLTACRACQSTDLAPIADFGRLPIAHRLLRSAGDAVERFPFALCHCRRCALVQVVDPIEAEILYRGYNYNFSSWKPEPHIDAELDLIFATATPQSVCEVGANDGRFLGLLRDRGVGRCIGIEPNPVSGGQAREKGFPIYGDFFDAALADRIVAEHGLFDLVVSRQVLEHTHGPAETLKAANRLLKPDGRIFIDVPDFGPSQALGDCTTLWEEHVSYFTEPTLTRVFARAGFTPVTVARYDFSGGCLAMLCRKAEVAPGGASADELTAVAGFVEKLTLYRDRLQRNLQQLRKSGWQIVMYGAGVRAMAAATMVGIGGVIDAAIDDQPERQSLLLPGRTDDEAIPIMGLDKIDTVGKRTLVLLAVNNENEAKVTAKLRSRHSDCKIVTLCGPADIWQGLAKLEAL